VVYVFVGGFIWCIYADLVVFSRTQSALDPMGRNLGVGVPKAKATPAPLESK